jgi:hypothetical protein
MVNPRRRRTGVLVIRHARAGARLSFVIPGRALGAGFPRHFRSEPLSLPSSFPGASLVAVFCHSGAMRSIEPGIHDHEIQLEGVVAPAMFKHWQWGLWIPGSRCARPGMTGQRSFARHFPERASWPSFVIPERASWPSFALPERAPSPSSVIPGRCEASSPESIATKFSWNAMWRRSCSNIGSGGYGFRARAAARPGMTG